VVLLELSLINNCNRIAKRILRILHNHRYCVRILTYHQRIMTLAKTGTAELTTEEWKELNALREAINLDPHHVHPNKMEKFTELFVRSLEGKGDLCIRTV